MALGAADKLIAKAAREVLKPLGLFQKGSSRIWIDDNGWFFTEVEFQPSRWSKGAYLNVAVSFLWDQGKGFQEILPHNIGGRENGHEEYVGNDDEFYGKMLEMAQHAKKKILEYRKYSESISAAKIRMNNYFDANSPMAVVRSWNLGMFHYFCGDQEAGDKQMQLIIDQYAPKEQEYRSGNEIYTREWVVELKKNAQLMLSRSSEDKIGFVSQSISEKRQRFRSKASYKRLPINPAFDQIES